MIKIVKEIDYYDDLHSGLGMTWGIDDDVDKK